MGLLLTDAGTDASSANRDGLTPLMAAAANGGGAAALNLLVAAGAAVNVAVAGGQRAGWTALMYAAAAGDAVAAAALCKLGADASAACARRRTAVRFATRFCASLLGLGPLPVPSVPRLELPVACQDARLAACSHKRFECRRARHSSSRPRVSERRSPFGRAHPARQGSCRRRLG